MKFLIAFLSALLVSAPILAADPAPAPLPVVDNVLYKTDLTGAGQQPPVVTGVKGEFIFTAIDNRWYLAVTGAPRDDKIVAAHIHCGAARINGPVIYPFYANSAGETSILIKGEFDPTKIIVVPRTTICPLEIKTIAQLRLAIRAGYIYVNVHTVKHPGGAVRGQVFRLL